jgi:uncharacterized membrane protein
MRLSPVSGSTHSVPIAPHLLGLALRETAYATAAEHPGPWIAEHLPSLPAHVGPLIHEELSMLGTIVLVVLVLMLLGALPTWGYSRSWGYAPTGILGLLVVIALIMLLTGRL